MAAPLSEGDRTVGALNVDSMEFEAFNDDDLRLLVLMANEASRVLANVWMIPAIRRKADQLQALVLVGQDVAGTRKVDGVLESITPKALATFELSVVCLFFFTTRKKITCVYIPFRMKRISPTKKT